MTSEDIRKDILFKLFIFYNEAKNILKMKEYHKRIVEKNISADVLSRLVDIAIDNNKYSNVPLFSDLIYPLKEEMENKKKILTNKKWEYFIKIASNPYSKLPPWVHTIKNNIGKYYIENHESKDVPWIRKAFEEQFGLLLSRQLKLKIDGKSWSRIGNSYVLESHGTIGIE